MFKNMKLSHNIKLFSVESCIMHKKVYSMFKCLAFDNC